MEITLPLKSCLAINDSTITTAVFVGCLLTTRMQDKPQDCAKRLKNWNITILNGIINILFWDNWKWNESGFRPLLCTYRLNWVRRTSWGWWDEWDDIFLQTQDSKFEPWWSQAEHAISWSRRLSKILGFTRGWERNIFFQTAETGNLGPPPPLFWDTPGWLKWNESGFRPPLCTYRLNWARRTSWGWWDDWDDTVHQTQDSKFEPWRSEAEHATSRSRRLPTILTFTRGWGRNNFVSFKPPRPGTEPRTLAWKAAVLTTTLGPPPTRVIELPYKLTPPCDFTLKHIIN